jgi:hypothetical protein
VEYLFARIGQGCNGEADFAEEIPVSAVAEAGTGHEREEGRRGSGPT